MTNRANTVKNYQIMWVLLAMGMVCLLSTTVHAAGLNVQNGLQLWLKADAITGLSDNDPVSVWPDSSPNGNDAVQSNVADQPLWSAATTVFGFMPTLTFTGEYSYNAGDGFTTTNVVPGGDDLTVFVALDVTVNNGERGILRDFDNTNGGFFLLDSKNANEDIYTFGTRTATPGNIQVLGGSTLPGEGVNIMTLLADGTNNSIFVDGVFESSTANAVPVGTSLEVLKIAKGFGDMDFFGSIAEILIYNRALNDVEMNQVGFYLEDKYSLDTAYIGPIPEPATLVVLSLGGLVMLRRRR